MSAKTPPRKHDDDLQSTAALSSLRDLLLGDEKVELDRVSADLDALQAKFDDQERFRQSVATVIADALTDARTHDQVRLARAISPIVASSIKREIVNSKDEMVEALYPITGRLVAASVRNSITKLGEEINERLERMFSFQGMMTRWRTQMTGGNTADLMLASTQKAEIQRAMIIERGSGILLGQWHKADPNHANGEAPDNPPENDMDLVSGLLSAISNLADEAFGGENTELRTLDLNGSQVALRRSPKHIVALEFTGALNADERLKLDVAFADCIERLIAKDETGAFAPFVALSDHSVPSEETQGKTTEKKPKKPRTSQERVKSLATFAVGLGIVALMVYGIWQWFEARSLHTDIRKIEAIIKADSALDGFPLLIEKQDGLSIRLTGLYPMQFNVEGFSQKVQNAIEDRPVAFDLQAVANPSDIDALRQEIRLLRKAVAAESLKEGTARQ